MISRKVQGDTANHLLSALAQVQMFNHGTLPVVLAHKGERLKVQEVVVRRNPITNEDEVILVAE